MSDKGSQEKTGKGQAYWLVYFALLLGGIILIAQAFDFTHITRWTAKLGIALIYSALALMIGNGRNSGYIAASIIWLVVIFSYFL